MPVQDATYAVLEQVDPELDEVSCSYGHYYCFIHLYLHIPRNKGGNYLVPPYQMLLLPSFKQLSPIVEVGQRYTLQVCDA